jgi:YHS domain-containing protein
VFTRDPICGMPLNPKETRYSIEFLRRQYFLTAGIA